MEDRKEMDELDVTHELDTTQELKRTHEIDEIDEIKETIPKKQRKDRHLWSVVLIIVIGIVLCGGVLCILTPDDAESVPQEMLQVSEMRAICELATQECYIRNVAKYNEEDVAGALWWKKDKCFWIEYTGIVNLGIDVSLLTLLVEGDTAKVTLPPIEVLSSRIDETTLTEDSFIIAKDSVSPTADEQTALLAAANEAMCQDVRSNKVLINNAQKHAQTLLTNYINYMGQMEGKVYTIEWLYMPQALPVLMDNVQASDSVQGDVQVNKQQE